MTFLGWTHVVGRGWIAQFRADARMTSLPVEAGGRLVLFGRTYEVTAVEASSDLMSPPSYMPDFGVVIRGEPEREHQTEVDVEIRPQTTDERRNFVVTRTVDSGWVR